MAKMIGAEEGQSQRLLLDVPMDAGALALGPFPIAFPGPFEGAGLEM